MPSLEILACSDQFTESTLPSKDFIQFDTVLDNFWLKLIYLANDPVQCPGQYRPYIDLQPGREGEKGRHITNSIPMPSCNVLMLSV